MPFWHENCFDPCIKFRSFRNNEPPHLSPTAMMPKTILPIQTLAAIFLTTCSISIASAQSTLYVGIYNQEQVLRYDESGNPITPTPWAGNGSALSPAVIRSEGIACGMSFPTTAQEPVANPIFIANTQTETIEIADANAATGTNPIVNANFITGLSGAANVALSDNGQDLYVAQETGNKISEYNALTGALVASTAFTGAHDVVVGSDGSVYVTAYGASNPTSLGVVRLDANLDASSETSFIAAGNNGLNHATGMVFDSKGNLWVADVLHPISTTPSTSNFVSEYSSTGQYILTVTEPQTGPNTNNLLTVFGLSLGPDGNIYAASFNGHEITEINTTTDTASTFITLPSGDEPKYATWESDCVTYSAVPEPRTYGVIFLGATMLLLGFRRFRQTATTNR